VSIRGSFPVSHEPHKREARIKGLKHGEGEDLQWQKDEDAEVPGLVQFFLNMSPKCRTIVFMNATLLNTRELSKETAKVLRDLAKTGPRVITRGGETVGILIAPSGYGIEHDIDLLARLRLGQALAKTQREAVIAGSDGISLEQIDSEIRETRTKRGKRNSR
jgi:hypothetical protein